MTTVIFARIPICLHSETGSQPTVDSWKIQAAAEGTWLRA
jgi:hypothetical protein